MHFAFFFSIFECFVTKLIILIENDFFLDKTFPRKDSPVNVAHFFSDFVPLITILSL